MRILHWAASVKPCKQPRHCRAFQKCQRSFEWLCAHYMRLSSTWTNPWLQNVTCQANDVLDRKKSFSKMRAALIEDCEDFWSEPGRWCENVARSAFYHAATLLGAEATLQDYLTSQRIPNSFPLPRNFWDDLSQFWGLNAGVVRRPGCLCKHLIEKWMTGEASIEHARVTCMAHILRNKKLVKSSLKLFRKYNLPRDVILRIMKL